jgi:hypothetical protein
MRVSVTLMRSLLNLKFLRDTGIPREIPAKDARSVDEIDTKSDISTTGKISLNIVCVKVSSST